MFIAAVLFLTFIGLGLWVYHLHTTRVNELNDEFSKLSKLISLHGDVRKILLAGIYQRFKKEEGKTEDTPYDFEKFVAKIIQSIRGGRVEVTPTSNDGGIDIMHYMNGDLYLGQVKCYAPNNPVNYEPIAILHSQMVRQQAKGGFLVTTSSYTDGAISYAEDTNIELINGEELINMWIETVKRTEDEIEGSFIPVLNNPAQ